MHPDTTVAFDAFMATPLGVATIESLLQAMPPGTEPEAAFAAIEAFGPSDAVDRMLAAQAVAAHFAAMASFGCAMQQGIEPRTADRARGRATALARTMRDAMRTIAQRGKTAEATAEPIADATPTPFERPQEVSATGNPATSGSVCPAVRANLQAKVLNGDPVRDWMSRRFAPEDDIAAAYADATLRSAALAAAENAENSTANPLA